MSSLAYRQRRALAAAAIIATGVLVSTTAANAASSTSHAARGNTAAKVAGASTTHKPRHRLGPAIWVTKAAAPKSTPTPTPTPTPMTSSATTSTPPPATTPWFGLLQPTTNQVGQLENTSVTRLVLAAGWDSIEPVPGQFNTSVLTQLAQRAAQWRSDGYAVILDLGLQYPPSWVFSLSGATRFVNQYGDIWHGTLSTDVPNAVFNPAVRAAEATYIAKLASALGPTNFSAVRVGGLLSGELRYPPATYNGHPNSLWDYDSLAQADAPNPGWKPGTGTYAEATAALHYYYDSLTAYEKWLMTSVQASFPDVNQLIMFPSWGLRPGMTEAAIAAGLRGTTTAEVNGMISSGLDWANQVKAIASTGLNATVYTTWLDAPNQGTSVQQIPPVAYLASLASQYGLPIAGENTGGGGQASLSISLSRAHTYGLTGVVYMSGGYIASGQASLTLSQLTSLAAALLPQP